VNAVGITIRAQGTGFIGLVRLLTVSDQGSSAKVGEHDQLAEYVNEPSASQGLSHGTADQPA
jgi:hypothetical protein